MKQGPAKERKEGNLEHDPVGDPRIMDVSKDWKQSSHSMNVEGLQGRCFKRGKNSQGIWPSKNESVFCLKVWG